MKTSSKITKVGIIGAGQMGSGIAHVCAQFGFDVLLYDIAKEVIDNSLRCLNLLLVIPNVLGLGPRRQLGGCVQSVDEVLRSRGFRPRVAGR